MDFINNLIRFISKPSNSIPLIETPNKEHGIESEEIKRQKQEITNIKSMLEPKYEFTGARDPLYNGFRIRALRDFGDVKAGDLGGYIHRQENLSHEGNCWVYPNARICNFAHVSGDAQIKEGIIAENAQINGNAQILGGTILGNAKVGDSAIIMDNVEIQDYAKIDGNAVISENALVCDNAHITGNALIKGYSDICGNVLISNDAILNNEHTLYWDHPELLEGKKYILTREKMLYPSKEYLELYRIQAVKDFGDVKSGDLGGWVESENCLSHEGNCWVYDEAKIGRNACVRENAHIRQNAIVCDHAQISGAAEITDNAFVQGNIHISGDIVFNDDFSQQIQIADQYHKTVFDDMKSIDYEYEEDEEMEM